MMADIVLYGSSQEIQSFPPLLIRAMSFGIPIMVPDLPALRNYVSLRYAVTMQQHNSRFSPLFLSPCAVSDLMHFLRLSDR